VITRQGRETESVREERFPDGSSEPVAKREEQRWEEKESTGFVRRASRMRGPGHDQYSHKHV